MSDVNELKKKVRELFPGDVQKAEEKNISVDKVCETLFEKYGERFNPKSLATKAKSELNKQVTVEESTSAKVILAGTRDRDSWSNKAPVKVGAVKSDGNHLDLSHFGMNVSVQKDSSTENVKMPVPCVAEAVIRYNERFKSYNLYHLKNVKKMSNTQLIKQLNKVVKKPSELKKADEHHIVVVKGSLMYANPTAVFNDQGEKVDTKPVFNLDEEGNPHPTLQINMAEDKGTRIHLMLDVPRISEPNYDVDDLIDACMAAMDENDDDDHVKQAMEVQEWIQGRNVFVVGAVTKFNKDQDNEGNHRNFVNIAPYAILELDKALEEKPQQQKQEQPQKKQEQKQEQEQKEQEKDEGYDDSEVQRLKEEQIKPALRAYGYQDKLNEINTGIIIEQIGVNHLEESIIEEIVKEIKEEGL